MNTKVWIDYISAMVNLYGIVPFAQVAKMLSAQTEETVSAQDIEKWVRDPFAGSLAKAALQRKFVYEYPGCFFVGEWIMEFESFDEHWARQQGKPFFEPAQEELLKWSDPDYLEKPDAFWELLHFIERTFPAIDRDVAEGIAEDIQMTAEDAFSIERIVQEFNRRKLALTEAQIKRVVELGMNLHNHTRLQINRGYTPFELFETDKQNLVPLPETIGRNAPCMCGSGKKFKKCCGK